MRLPTNCEKEVIQMCMLSAEEIGRRIKTRREELNISRSELMEKANINDSALSNYESGLRIPRDEKKISIAKALKMDVQALFFN